MRSTARAYSFYAVAFDPRNSPVSPIRHSTTPPISIHIALSVGEPVKKREMSEPSEFDALVPKIMSMTPTARIARENALYMKKPSFIRLQGA